MEQIVGALILAAGAFLGVWKGAVYAANRLIVQLDEHRVLEDQRLDAEAARLRAQLDAEAARLDRQLAHDREMRDLEEMRRALHEVSVSMWGLTKFTVELEGIGEICKHLPEGMPWETIDDILRKLLDQHSGLDSDLHARSQYLFLRLHAGDPVFDATRDFLAVAHKMANLYRRPASEIGDPERAEFSKLRGQLADAYAAFAARCLQLVGTRDVQGELKDRIPSGKTSTET